MDKNTFETYEYLPSNDSGMDTDEFLVVQDDGTLLLNRQVQYVAQVQDAKEVLGHTQAAVYDVTAQQYFVDVADNPSELISVADNYILPEHLAASEDTNNLYSNSFLLQVVSNDNSQQANKNVAMEHKERSTENQPDVNIKKGNNHTEITLTDEQYKTLEQKGCVLLELNNKIFILDSYGLHEVAANTELISSLKGSSLMDVDTSTKIDTDEPLMKIESICSLQPSEPNLDEPVSLAKQDFSEETAQPNIVSTKEAVKAPTANDVPLQLDSIRLELANNLKKEFLKNTVIKEYPKKGVIGKTLKIKTKYCFKEMPDKIVLGKTANGKKLVARVVKKTLPKGENTKEKVSLLKPQETRVEPVNTEVPVHIVKQPLKKPDENEFEQLVQRALLTWREWRPEQVAAAHEIVAQLFHVPAIHSSVTGRNVLITKVIQNAKKNKDTSTITGIVTTNEDGSCCFTHVPDLLQNLMAKYVECQTIPSADTKLLDLTILHVNISESKYENNVETISVVLNERVLPCEALIRKPQVNTFHACSTCAAIFESPSQLEQHQEVHTIDAEDTLTIDTDKLPPIMYSGKPLYVEQTPKGIEYSCYQCPMKFNKLSNYSRHIVTHGETKRNSDSENEQSTTKSNRRKPLYRCKICNCSYYYPSSLAKHISNVHIKSQVDSINDKVIISKS